MGIERRKMSEDERSVLFESQFLVERSEKGTNVISKSTDEDSFGHAGLRTFIPKGKSVTFGVANGQGGIENTEIIG